MVTVSFYYILSLPNTADLNDLRKYFLIFYKKKWKMYVLCLKWIPWFIEYTLENKHKLTFFEYLNYFYFWQFKLTKSQNLVPHPWLHLFIHLFTITYRVTQKRDPIFSIKCRNFRQKVTCFECLKYKKNRADRTVLMVFESVKIIFDGVT